MTFVGQETINIQILWLPVGCCESGRPVVTGAFLGTLVPLIYYQSQYKPGLSLLVNLLATCLQYKT